MMDIIEFSSLMVAIFVIFYLVREVIEMVKNFHGRLVNGYKIQRKREVIKWLDENMDIPFEFNPVWELFDLETLEDVMRRTIKRKMEVTK